MPTVYNNGLQIVQGSGYVAITKEMIHETRIIPTEERPRLGSGLTLWLGNHKAGGKVTRSWSKRPTSMSGYR